MGLGRWRLPVSAKAQEEEAESARQLEGRKQRVKQICIRVSDEADTWLTREAARRTQGGAVASPSSIIRDLIGQAMNRDTYPQRKVIGKAIERQLKGTNR